MLVYNNSLPTLREDEQYFNDVFGDFFKARGGNTRQMNCDIQELDEHYLLTIEMPGIAKDDIKIEVKSDRLTVTASKKNLTEEDHKSFLKRERSFGTFTRSFTLSEMLDTEQIEASYEDGVLHLAIPKKAEVKPRFVDIKAEKSSLLGKLIK